MKEIGVDREIAGIEFYDYSLGKVERSNIADDHPEIVRELYKILDQQPEAHPVRPESRR